MAEEIDDKLAAWDEGVKRFCFLSTSRTIPRWVEAVRGKEGCESQVKEDE